MASSIIETFFATAQRRGEHPAIYEKVADQWRAISWERYAADVKRGARALMKLGLPVGGAVVILGPNRPEWLIADLAAIAAGGLPAPIYPTSTAEQVGYVASHCEATIAVVNDPQQLAKLRAQCDKLPHLKQFVLMQGEGDGAADVLSWAGFLALGDQVPEAELSARLAAIEPQKAATLIYTSGTTGPPKAVTITHANLVFAAAASCQFVNVTDADVLVSYLPLSHIAEQALSIHGAATIGYTVWCCERFELLPEAMRAARPTAFLGVPRVWEKMQAKMQEAGASAPWLKRKIAAWARGVGLRAGAARQRGERLPLLYPLAKKLVFSTVRARLGLDRAWYCISGAAPISKSTLEFFLSLDIPICELYGMSEVTGAATISTPTSFRIGTVGKVLPQTELKIAEDGEILIRGGHVFAGYRKDEAATAEAIDAEGWLHSGDVGEFDGDGFLRITDRKKDLFKTSGGKFVAPQNLEALLKGIPGVGQAVVVGDQRKYIVALLTLDPDGAAREAQACSAGGRSVAEWADDRVFLARLESHLQAMNRGLAPYETIKRFKVLPAEFTVDSGELTPSMKVKRKVVNQRYAREIDALYAE